LNIYFACLNFINMKDTSEILESIKNIRKEKRLTQKEVANKLYISREMYSKYESRKAEITLDLFLKIVQVLEIDILDILSIKPNVSKETLKEFFEALDKLQNVAKRIG